jgi:hypothetical protein
MSAAETNQLNPSLTPFGGRAPERRRVRLFVEEPAGVDITIRIFFSAGITGVLDIEIASFR